MYVCMKVCIMYIFMYVCMYVCIYVWMYVCMLACMYVRMYESMYVCMYACMYESMYICIYLCMCVCLYVCIYVWIYVCTRACMYVWKYVYMYICVYIYVCILYMRWHAARSHKIHTYRPEDLQRLFFRKFYIKPELCNCCFNYLVIMSFDATVKVWLIFKATVSIRYSATLQRCPYKFVNRKTIVCSVSIFCHTIYDHKLRWTNSGTVSAFDSLYNLLTLTRFIKLPPLLFKNVWPVVDSSWALLLLLATRNWGIMRKLCCFFFFLFFFFFFSSSSYCLRNVC